MAVETAVKKAGERFRRDHVGNDHRKRQLDGLAPLTPNFKVGFQLGVGVDLRCDINAPTCCAHLSCPSSSSSLHATHQPSDLTLQSCMFLSASPLPPKFNVVVMHIPVPMDEKKCKNRVRYVRNKCSRALHENSDFPPPPDFNDEPDLWQNEWAQQV